MSKKLTYDGKTYLMDDDFRGSDLIELIPTDGSVATATVRTKLGSFLTLALGAGIPVSLIESTYDDDTSERTGIVL